jgi:spore germination protein
MKKLLKLLILVSICIPIISGCAERKVLEEVGLIQAVGYDLTDEGKLEGTFIVPIFRATNEATVQKYSAVANTSKGIRRKINSMTEKPLQAGQIRIALYSENLAKQGIINVVDTLYRDPSIGNRMNLGIVRGETKDILTKDYPNRESVASYLQELMIHNIKNETLPSQNLHLFLYRLYNDGQDPFMPIFKHTNGNHIKIEKIGLFKEDKLEHEISLEKGFLLKLMLEGYKSGKYELTLDKQEEDDKATFVVVENLNSNSVYYLKKMSPYPKFYIKIKMKGQINEYSGKLNMESSNTIKEIEKQLEKKIEEDAIILIRELQDKGVDPIGFGKKYRSKTRDWDPKEFKEKLYPKMEVDVSVEIKIIESGIVE